MTKRKETQTDYSQEMQELLANLGYETRPVFSSQVDPENPSATVKLQKELMQAETFANGDFAGWAWVNLIRPFQEKRVYSGIAPQNPRGWEWDKDIITDWKRLHNQYLEARNIVYTKLPETYPAQNQVAIVLLHRYRPGRWGAKAGKRKRLR